MAGAFNVPDVPGASGYATVYLSPNLPIPIVLLAGFDLDESHLAEEEIDYGNPSITARDVVDRETLKAFVTQAGEFFLEHQTSGDLTALSKARIAMRESERAVETRFRIPLRPGSCQQHRPVSRHGAGPTGASSSDRRARDGVTGELILPRVLAAATSNPEGGFVEYYYDDPADDTDRADIPKVGYAREFSGELVLGGRATPVNFVIGSGI